MPLDLQEAATMLGVSPETVQRWARQGRLGVRRPTGGFRFEVAELERWARSHGLRLHRPQQAVSAAAPVGVGRPLAAALARGAVLREVPGGTPEEVLSALVAEAPLPDTTDREALLEQLLARESMASTALGGGVALPHPRTPSADYVDEPTVVIGMLAAEIDWHALDGAPVHTALLLLSPTPQQHLQVLSRVAFLLRDGAFTGLLRERADAEVVAAAVAEREPAAG